MVEKTVGCGLNSSREKCQKGVCNVKFREEVLARIFTYITVILLLGIIIFEAWSLQNERSKLKEIQKTADTLQENLDTVISMNANLQENNEELKEFQSMWLPYAAFVESSEVLTLKTDLFTRSDLIPQEAIDEVWKLHLLKEEEEGEAGETHDNDGKAENALEFTFDNPDGEDIFLPLGTDAAHRSSCLIYTAAFEKEEEIAIELLYEVSFEEEDGAVELDENGQMIWHCVAYNIGEGWSFAEGEQDDDD